MILLGGPGGVFGAPQVVTAYLDTDSYVVEAGDFNDDGLTDLAAGSYGTTRLTVMLGDGNGNFQVSGQYVLGAPPTDFAIDDFNLDGIPDIIASTYFGGSLIVLLGNGDGTFTAAPSIATGNSALVTQAEDFNGDGIPDLAVTDGVPTDLLMNQSLGELNIMFGNGDGTFLPKDTYTIGAIPEVIQYGDLDEDGKKDLLVTNAASNEVSVLYGLGAGQFAAEKRFSVGPTGGGLEGMRLADFDRDGHLDLVVSQITSNTIIAFKGDGLGNFSQVGEYPVANFPEQFIAADLNGNGCLDLAVNGNLPPAGPADVGTARVSVFINKSAGCQ